MFESGDRKGAKTLRNRQSGVWRRVRQLLAIVVVTVMVAGGWLVTVEAAAGALDPTFSGDGKQITNFGDFDFANAMAIQADGKIVVAGYALSSSTGYDFAVARYNTNGTLDTTFSEDGKQTTDFSGHDDRASGVAIQSDGKIVVAGGGPSPMTGIDFAVARYNTNGTLDTTFSTDGKLTTDFAGHDDYASGVAIQANGKIVAAGYANSSTTDSDFAVVRYNTNGALDTTFSTDGKQTTNFFVGSNDVANGVAIQANGKIVAAGYATNSMTGIDFAVARYNTNGTLDTTFSGDGKQITVFSSGSDYARAVAIQANGRIVVAGSTSVGGSRDFALARYNGNGSPDDGSVDDSTPSDHFGTGGRVTTDFFNSIDFARAVAIQTDGKIVAAGSAAHANATNYDFAVARYNTSGALDTSFSTDGKQNTNFSTFNFPTPTDEGRGIAIQTDGKIVVAGYTTTNFAVARYLGD